MAATSASALPFEVRVHALESRIYGPQYSTSSSSDSHTGAQSRNIQTRIRDIEETLDRAAQSSDALKRLRDGYRQYLPLLSLDGQSTATGSGTGEAEISESDLLPDSTKLTMVLEAAGDIKHAERTLRDIDVLNQQGAAGAGDLESMLPFKGDLIKGMEGAQDRSKKLRESRKDVIDLLRRYNEFTTTASDLFLELHHRIEAMEEAVAKKESKRRKERAAQY